MFEVSTYKNKPAVFDTDSRCFVLFGKKKELKERVKQLNNSSNERK